MKLKQAFILSLLILNIVNIARTDFAVISDIHYDAFYKEGSPTSCLLGKTGIGCCRSWDIGNGSAPEFGISGCDTPKSLLEKIFDWLAVQKLDFLVYLGDTVDHDLPIQGWTYNLDEIATIANFTRNLPYPVFTTLGNHDGYIVDNLWTDEWGTEWLEQISDLTDSNLITGGYYNVTINGTLMLFLNCLTYDTHNVEVLLEPDSDLFNQTAWLQSQIASAESRNQTVFLFSHFGSDTGEATDFYNDMISNFTYPKIRYFAGHSHHDEIRPFGNDTLKGIFYIHPSIVPDGHFPEIRVYKTSETSLDITDYDQYGFNLTSLQFEKVYSVLESYALPDLSLSGWQDFFIRLKNDTALQELVNYHYNWGQ